MVMFSRLGGFGMWSNNHRSTEHITAFDIPPPNKFESATLSVGVNMVLPERYHTNVHFPNYHRTWNGPFDPKALMLPGFGPFLYQMGFSGGETTQEIIIVHEY